MFAQLEADIFAAVDTMIDDFMAGRREDYLAAYTEDATLTLYGVSGRVESRDELRLLLLSWDREHAFQMISARSTERRVQLVGTAAVFTHTLETQFRFDGIIERKFERESLVFERRDGRWLCAHEHLSVKP